MMALLAVVMIGCAEDPGLVLPPDHKPNNPTPPAGSTELPFISTNPDFVTEAMTEDITVILNTEGTAAEDFSGDLYAHTGVLTTESTSTGDWKYVLSEWGENVPRVQARAGG